MACQCWYGEIVGGLISIFVKRKPVQLELLDDRKRLVEIQNYTSGANTETGCII